MDVSAYRDEFGRLIAVLKDGPQEATVTASNMPAAGEDLLAAVASARDTGYGECRWQEQTGDYWWMLRNTQGRLTVVVMWATGTATGWQHVFRAETDMQAFEKGVGSSFRKNCH
jgi:hypothetical protein